MKTWGHGPFTILKIKSSGEKIGFYGDGIVTSDAFMLPLKIGSRVVGYFKNGNFVTTSQDHLGSAITDENGNINYSTPYGERDSRSEVSEFLDYTLKGFDDDIDAVRMGHRFYDPVAKRFLAPDLYMLENPEKCVERPTDCNLYSYAINNPLSYIDPTGDAPPLEKESKITSGFGPRNIAEGAGDVHKGVDLRASEGSKVRAVADGYVYASGPPKKGEAGGTRVMIKHTDGSYSVSRHIKPSVPAGTRVKEGQTIGNTCTGGVCGTKQPHLHFERVRPGETKLTDPKDFLIKEFKSEGLKLNVN